MDRRPADLELLIPQANQPDNLHSNGRNRAVGDACKQGSEILAPNKSQRRQPENGLRRKAGKRHGGGFPKKQVPPP